MCKYDKLLLKNVWNIKCTFLRSKWKCHTNEVKSVDIWILTNWNDFFSLQKLTFVDGLNSNFMLDYGDQSTIFINVTFEISVCKYYLYIHIVFDACLNGFLGAWIITNEQNWRVYLSTWSLWWISCDYLSKMTV